MKRLKLIINGIPCETDLSGSSSAPNIIFASAEDYLRSLNNDEICGYCNITFRPVVKEIVNEKVCCPNCRQKLVPPICTYFDKHRMVHDSRVGTEPMHTSEYINHVLRKEVEP